MPPSRRPRSRSEQNGEPPTGASTCRPAAADRDGPVGIARLERERRRRTRHHLEHELAIPADALAVDVLPVRAQEVEGARVTHVCADLLEDRHRTFVHRLDVVGRQDRDRLHRRRLYQRRAGSRSTWTPRRVYLRAVSVVVEQSVAVGASPAAVFAFLHAPERRQEWDSMVDLARLEGVP